MITNDAGQVTFWPDRAGIVEDAAPVEDAQTPLFASAMIHGHMRPVVRFQGQELLQAPRSVPPIGSLFVVFRPSEANVSGQRLVGWEDSSVGQHGVGLIADPKGAVHAVVRRNGANGDVVAPAAATPDFQLLSLTWGPIGVTLHRRRRGSRHQSGDRRGLVRSRHRRLENRWAGLRRGWQVLRRPG